MQNSGLLFSTSSWLLALGYKCVYIGQYILGTPLLAIGMGGGGGGEFNSKQILFPMNKTQDIYILKGFAEAYRADHTI